MKSQKVKKSKKEEVIETEVEAKVETAQIELKESKDAQTSGGNSIFVSGIPYETTVDELKSIFEEFGTILDVKLPKYQDSGRNRGYAHITFKKDSDAQKALIRNKYVIGKRYITVEFSKGESKPERKVDSLDIPEGCSTIIIRNLSYDITEQELGDKFKPCGSISSIRLVYHSKLNHFKGFAYIDFENPESVKIALHLNDKELKGRKMVVDFEDERPKQGYKFRSSEPSKFNKEYNEKIKKTLQKKRAHN